MPTKDIERTLALIGLPQAPQLQAELQADMQAELSADLAANIKRVMGYTSELVESALQADWLAVLEGLDTRRKLLQSIVDGQQNVPNPQLAALSEAVSESERALMRVVAHAIASSRNSGGLYAMYH
jgi:hypothetical protein